MRLGTTWKRLHAHHRRDQNQLYGGRMPSDDRRKGQAVHAGHAIVDERHADWVRSEQGQRGVRVKGGDDFTLWKQPREQALDGLQDLRLIPPG
jgi:hypothetical protein